MNIDKVVVDLVWSKAFSLVNYNMNSLVWDIAVLKNTVTGMLGSTFINLKHCKLDHIWHDRLNVLSRILLNKLLQYLNTNILL